MGVATKKPKLLGQFLCTARLLLVTLALALALALPLPFAKVANKLNKHSATPSTTHPQDSAVPAEAAAAAAGCTLCSRRRRTSSWRSVAGNGHVVVYSKLHPFCCINVFRSSTLPVYPSLYRSLSCSLSAAVGSVLILVSLLLVAVCNTFGQVASFVGCCLTLALVKL